MNGQSDDMKQEDLENKQQDQENMDNNNQNNTPPEKNEEEDLFDPFASLREDGEDEEKENTPPAKKEDNKSDDGDDNKKAPFVDEGLRNEFKADKEARREVEKYIKENPEHEELRGDLEELVAGAMVRGYKKPLEFAVRNVRPPKYWIEKARKETTEAIENAQSTRIGGNVGGLRGGDKTPDYQTMPTDKFNKILSDLTRG